MDAEARFARFPEDFTIKGMFLSRMSGLAGQEQLAALRPSLRRWPTAGRYLPFGDYPQVDYSRITHAVARSRFASLEPLEAMRTLARQDLETFLGSRIGSIMMGLAGGLEDALLRAGDMYAASLRGGTVRTRRLPDGRIELAYRDFHGWVDSYAIGTLEGLIAHYHGSVEMEIELESEIDATFRVKVHE